ncbi:MAG: PEP-CTERM sorting domain-containing protein [Candidatus Brocadiae bacterium]|nr:PEP-CTERM sorting domain-containing protein [Candidatus Brocadiia bacterium]
MRTQTMARSVFALVCGAVALVLLATPADATVITVHTGDGAGADSYIRGGSNADLNHGQEANVYIKDSGTNNSYTRKGYLRFDLTGIDLSQVYDVALVQTVSNNNAPGGWTVDVWGLADGHAGEAWVEGNGGTGDSPAGEIDWNNAPGNNSSGSSMASPPMTEFGDLTVPSGVNGWGGPDGAAGAVIAFGTPTFTQFVTSDTDGLVTVALTRNNVNGNTGSHNLGFASKEHPTYGSPFLRLKIAEPGDGIVQFADTGFDATTAFAGDGTSDGPWEVARMQMNTGDPVNLAFSITSNTTFLGHTTGGHPGSFVAVQTTSTSNRALAFLGQRLAPSAGDLVTDVALSFDLQRNSPNSTRAPMIGLALFDATAWEARQPGQSLLDANDNPTSAANIGALWVTQLLQGGYQGDLFSWVGMTLTDLQVDDLVGALNQHIGEDLVLAVYETDYWNGTESFVYIDNFALTITYTPEPGTAMLLGMGGLALARRYRRRRKA